MKLSLNTAQFYSNVDLKSIPKEKIIASAGAQLGGIEEVIDWAPRYEGAVVAKIVSVADHPDADRLHVCMVDDGKVVKNATRDGNGLVQVVCGAPNVREGLFVVWLPPGVTVPSSFGDKEPFVLGARELRGVVSNGMLASAKELGISDDHDGILEIDPREVGRTPKPGEPFVEYFGLDDLVLDFENKMFTHRPDCFGNLGLARELAGINGFSFKSPDWYLSEPQFEQKSDVKLTVKNEAGKVVPRLMAVAMNNVAVGKSPVWLQAALARLGMKTINNVVDITNFVMALTGQPLHAYDADKLGSTLLSRMAKKGEKLALLNGKTIELTEDDIVIANAEKPVGLAAIMGGNETEVDESTKNIVIECASFDMYTIRRSSMHHGVFSEASTRFTKGQSPLQNSRVVAYAMKNMSELAGAKQTSVVYDLHARLEEPADITLTADFINDRLGSKLSLNDIAKLLESVEFIIKTVPADKNHLHIKPPFWRTDIEMPEDIVEEVGRLYGYDKLPVALPARSAKAAPKDYDLSLKKQIRELLAEAGANEVLTYSFVHGDLLKKVGQSVDEAYALRNALSPELQYYRMSISPSLLDKMHMNIRSGSSYESNDFVLFEIGKGHKKGVQDKDEPAVPNEEALLALVFAADDKTAAKKYEGAPFYQAKKYLSFLLDRLGASYSIEPFGTEPLQLGQQTSSVFEPSRSATVNVNGKLIGFLGEYTASVRASLKLPAYSAGFEIAIDALGILSKTAYLPLSVFPKTQQDITFETSTEVGFSVIAGELDQVLRSASAEHGYAVRLAPKNIYHPDDQKVRYTFRISLSHFERTLVTAEVNTLLDTIASELKTKLNAERI